MDHLTDLLNTATSAEEPAGQQRVDSLTAAVRNLDTEADLSALASSAADEFERLFNDGDYDPSESERMEALVDVAQAVRSVADERQQRQQRLTDAAQRVRAATTPADGAEAPTGEHTDTAEATGEAGSGADTPSQSASAPDTGTSGEPDGDPDDPNSTEDEPATEQPEQQPQQQPEQDPAEPSSPSSEPAPDSSPPADGAGEETDAELVAASAGQPAQRHTTTAALNNARETAVTQAAPEQAAPEPIRSVSITASAEVPDVPYGKNLSMPEVAEASAARFATFPVGEQTSGTMKANVARINRHYTEQATLTGNQDDVERIDALADEKRLPGGSVVAASAQRTKALTAATQAPSTVNDVWCTPSETDYTLCPPLATTEGMLDLPTTGMPNRGGIRYPTWLQYPDQPADWRGEAIAYPDQPADPGTGLDNPGYFESTADGGLGNTKRCIQGPCVEWNEVRASLSYLCVTSSILRDRTFPEGLERFLSDVLVHHQHYMNETYLNYIIAQADPIPAFSVQNGPGQIGSSSLSVIDRLALLVTWMRGRYKMAEGATLELIAPSWFREYLKRDLEKKQNRPYGAVSNAEVDALFATYASRVQWVLDWQEIGDGTAVNGRLMPPADWPDQVQLMAYPAGSWVLSEGNILSLGVQYDHQLLQSNQYSAMFTEDSWMLLNRCNRTFSITLSELCANGATGPMRDACAPAELGTTSSNPVYTQEVGTA